MNLFAVLNSSAGSCTVFLLTVLPLQVICPAIFAGDEIRPEAAVLFDLDLVQGQHHIETQTGKRVYSMGPLDV